MKLSLSPKLMEKVVWVPVISFCKIFIPNYTFDAHIYASNIWPTLRITLLLTSSIIDFGLNFYKDLNLNSGVSYYFLILLLF
jgi:hypothetical protein